MPEIDLKSVAINHQCDLNSSKYFDYVAQNDYPYRKTKDIHNNSVIVKAHFSKAENNAYCLLQDTFQSLNAKTPKLLTKIPNRDNSEIYEKQVKNLEKNDTMVLVIPGIFGEYIQQVAFGEIFGQGLTDLEGKGNLASSFARDFFQKVNSHPNDEVIAASRKDNRFLLKNIRSFKKTANNSDLYESIDIADWIKVASYDNNEGKALFKVAVLGLEPMSLESLGKQEDLALIYSRRINKFMKIYSKIYGNVPNQIIFVGYSRGTPIAYEMLALLNKNRRFKTNSNSGGETSDSSASYYKRQSLKASLNKEAQSWVNNVIGMVSLGGVSIGSALADGKVIFRNESPQATKVIQGLKVLMSSLEIINQEDIETVKAATVNLFNNTDPSIVNPLCKGKIITKKNKDRCTAPAYDISSVDRGGVQKNVLQPLAPVKEKIKHNLNALINFKNMIANLPVAKESESISRGAKAIQKLNGLSEDLIKVFTLDENWLSSYKNIEKVSSEQIKQSIIDLISATNALMPHDPVDLPDAHEISEKVQDYAQSILDKKLSVKPVTTEATEKFTQRILGNYGLLQSKENIVQTYEKDPLASIIKIIEELNLHIEVFQQYFMFAWQGGSELSTLSRLSWFIQNGKFLPTENLTYFSVSAIMSNPQSEYYKQGLNYGFNNSSDELFLNNSWLELKSVGHSKGDGLIDDKTFAGSTWNDSQVDWYKTILWPHLVKVFTNNRVSNLRFKVLGLLRTHHWGLALPFAFLNHTKHDANTGLPITDSKPVTNVNPIPRAELLKSIVMAIDFDKNQQVKDINP